MKKKPIWTKLALPEHCVVQLRRQLILTGFLVHKKLCSWFCRAVLPTRLLFSRKLCLSQWRGSKWRVEGHENYAVGAPWLQEKSSSTKVLSLCFLQCTKTRAVRLFHVLMREEDESWSSSGSTEVFYCFLFFEVFLYLSFFSLVFLFFTEIIIKFFFGI